MEYVFNLMSCATECGNPPSSIDIQAFVTTIATSFVLIVGAEMGDKSQLVCMTLAARHRPWPVLFGAVQAFAVLNMLAVLFGAALASWIPHYLMAAGVAVLFAVFGVQALRQNAEDDDEDLPEKSTHNLLFSTFLLIIMAEFGDKTQLAVVAYSSTASALAVWIGATLALTLTSALGVWAGRTVLQRLPMHWLHRFSGVLFLILAATAGYRAWQSLPQEIIEQIKTALSAVLTALF